MRQFSSIQLFPSEIIQEIQACLSLAIPLSLAQLIEISILTVDTWFMGMLGSEFLAGGALGYMTFSYLLGIGICIISAVNAVAAIAFGAKEFQKLSHIPTQGFYLALLLALPMMFILGSAAAWMKFLGQEVNNIELAQSYLKTVLWGLPALFGYEVLRNTLTAISHSKIIIIIAICSIFLNIGADYVFAFGKFGFPASGLAGIGWATTFVLWFQFLASLGFIFINQNLREYKFFQQGCYLDTSIFNEIIRIGWASGVHAFSAGGVTIVLVYLLGYLGSIPLAAYQIARQVNGIIRHIVIGLAQAVTARVGQMYGLQDLTGLRRAGGAGFIIGVFFTVIYIIVVAINRTSIVSIFLTPTTASDFETFQLACTFLIIVSILHIFNEIDTLATAALLGIKDTKIPMIIGLISYWGVGLGSTYLLAFHWNFQSVGILLGEYLGLFVTGVILTLRFFLKTRQMP